jgi:hypothetical protein
LIGYLGVRAEVDHHQRPTATSPQQLIDHTARDHGLAKTDFVSQEEAPRAAAVRQATTDGLNGGALELG